MNAKLIVCCFLGMIALSMAAHEYCTKDKDGGICMGYFPRFYFNHVTGKCEGFTYGGCQGNENNFEQKADCEAACAAS